MRTPLRAEEFRINLAFYLNLGMLYSACYIQSCTSQETNILLYSDYKVPDNLIKNRIQNHKIFLRGYSQCCQCFWIFHSVFSNVYLIIYQILTLFYVTLQLGKTPLQLASRGSFVAIVDMIIKAERYYAVARVIFYY